MRATEMNTFKLFFGDEEKLVDIIKVEKCKKSSKIIVLFN